LATAQNLSILYLYWAYYSGLNLPSTTLPDKIMRLIELSYCCQSFVDISVIYTYILSFLKLFIMSNFVLGAIELETLTSLGTELDVLEMFKRLLPLFTLTKAVKPWHILVF